MIFSFQNYGWYASIQVHFAVMAIETAPGVTFGRTPTVIPGQSR